ncbi:DUF4198 domain-containing protein [soil metagenome]
MRDWSLSFISAPALLAGILLAAPAPAHEYWLEPEVFQLDPETRLEARGFVGETLEGDELGYYPQSTVHLDLTLGDETVPLTGEVGQLPVVDTDLLGSGLHILRFQSANYEVSYPTFEKFDEFLREWNLEWARDEHVSNDFPRADIREVYFRYAKALVASGEGEGDDRALGMPFELVALTNPYAEPAPEQIEIELRFQGEPLADGRVKHFYRAPDGTVEKTRLRTNGVGRLSVPAGPGFHLINAVYLDLASQRMQMLLGASWQSLWASLTYGID